MKKNKTLIKRFWRVFYSPIKITVRSIKIRKNAKIAKIAGIKLTNWNITNITNSLNEIGFGDDDFVIISNIFYDISGSFCWNGGSERYYKDLSEVITSTTKKKVVIIQLICKELIIKKDLHYLFLTIKGTDNPKFHQDILNRVLKNTNIVISDIGIIMNLISRQVKISHGICFDRNGLLQNYNNQQLISLTNSIKEAEIFVSVDAVTISFFAALMGKELYKNSIYIPNYYNQSTFIKKENQDGNLTILYPRRLSEERGFEMMLEISKEIMLSHGIKIIFCGNGQEIEVEKVRNLVSEFPFLCRHLVLKPEEMDIIYQESDIVVIPTQYSEGTSLSCIEAMGNGKAIITTYVGGLSNLVINNYNGILCSTNKSDIKNSIIELIENEDLRIKLSSNAKLVSQSFSKDMWKKNWESVLLKFNPNSK